MVECQEGGIVLTARKAQCKITLEDPSLAIRRLPHTYMSNSQPGSYMSNTGPICQTHESESQTQSSETQGAVNPKHSQRSGFATSWQLWRPQSQRKLWLLQLGLERKCENGLRTKQPHTLRLRGRPRRPGQSLEQKVSRHSLVRGEVAMMTSRRPYQAWR